MRTDAAVKLPPGIQWLAAIASVLLISSLVKLGETSLAVGLIPSPWDKVAHAATFGAITVSLWLGAGQRWLPVCAGIALAIGAYDEWRQLSLPGREADVIDLLANASGIVLASLLAHRLAPRFR